MEPDSSLHETLQVEAGKFLCIFTSTVTAPLMHFAGRCFAYDGVFHSFVEKSPFWARRDPDGYVLYLFQLMALIFDFVLVCRTGCILYV